MAEVTALALPTHVVDDILSDLTRGYRTTREIAKRHKVSVAIVDELRRNGRPAPPPDATKAESGKWTDGLTAEERAECRAWCKANRVKVTASGRIARPIVAQWREATSSNATTDAVEEEAALDAPAAALAGDAVVDAEIQDGDAPIPRCRGAHPDSWHHYGQDACFAGACGCAQFRDAGEPVEDSDPCPTCSGPVRETVGMVCQTCGTDYAKIPHSVTRWAAGVIEDATEPRPDLRDLLRAAVTEVDARLDFAIAHAPDAVEQLITACGEFVEWARTVEGTVRRVDAVESRLRESAETGELTDGDLRSLAEALVKVVGAA